MSFEHISSVLKLHPHIAVLWCFCKISVTSEVSFLGVVLKTKTRKSRKIFIYLFFLLRLYQIDFCVYISLFSVVDNTVTLFSCFFRGFRDFRDFRSFRVFDLARIRRIHGVKRIHRITEVFKC